MRFYLKDITTPPDVYQLFHAHSLEPGNSIIVAVGTEKGYRICF